MGMKQSKYGRKERQVELVSQKRPERDIVREERNDSRGACEQDGEELKADETSLEMQKDLEGWRKHRRTSAYIAISGQAYRLAGVNSVVRFLVSNGTLGLGFIL